MFDSCNPVFKKSSSMFVPYSLWIARSWLKIRSRQEIKRVNDQRNISLAVKYVCTVI